MTIEERLTKLERKNRWLTLALVLVVLTTGFFFTVRMWATGNVPNKVIARSFRVVDAKGKVIAYLGGEEGEPILRLRDKLVEETTAELGADGLRLFHNKHANSAILPADEFDLNENSSVMLTGGGTPALRMWDENGKDRVMLSDTLGLHLRDENGKGKVVLDVDKNGPSIWLDDKNGKERVVLDVGKNGPSIWLDDKNGKGRVLLAVDKSGPSIWLDDKNGKGRVLLAVDKSGPGLCLYDENGRLLRSLP